MIRWVEFDEAVKVVDSLFELTHPTQYYCPIVYPICILGNRIKHCEGLLELPLRHECNSDVIGRVVIAYMGERPNALLVIGETELNHSLYEMGIHIGVVHLQVEIYIGLCMSELLHM